MRPDPWKLALEDPLATPPLDAAKELASLAVEARPFLSAAHATAALQGNAAFEAALESARECCQRQLAQLFYALALAHFAKAERTNAQVYVRGPVQDPKNVESSLAAAAETTRSFRSDPLDEDGILSLASASTVGGNPRARSRRWCRAAIEASQGKHWGALELLAAHLVIEGRQDAALAIYEFIAKEASSSRRRGSALSNSAKALLDLGQPRAAAEVCVSALRNAEEDGLTLANLAVSKLLVRDVRGALRAYTHLARVAGRDASLGEKLPELLASDLAFARHHVGIPARDFQAMWKELQSLGLVRRKRGPQTLSVETSSP